MKKSFCIALIFIVLVVSFQEFVITKLLRLSEQKNEIENELIEKKKLERKNKNQELEYKNLRKMVLTLEEEEKRKKASEKTKKGFGTEVDFEYFIKKHLNNNRLILKSIARVEREGENRYFPYEFSGGLNDLLNFFMEIENSEMDVSLADTPFVINNDKKANFIGKIKGRIIGKECKKREEKIGIERVSKKEIQSLKFVTINANRYLIIRYVDKSSIALKKGEKVKIDGKIYEVDLGEDRVELRENDGGKECGRSSY